MNRERIRVPMTAPGASIGAGPQSHDYCDLNVRPALLTYDKSICLLSVFAQDFGFYPGQQ